MCRGKVWQSRFVRGWRGSSEDQFHESFEENSLESRRNALFRETSVAPRRYSPVAAVRRSRPKHALPLLNRVNRKVPTSRKWLKLCPVSSTFVPPRKRYAPDPENDKNLKALPPCNLFILQILRVFAAIRLLSVGIFNGNRNELKLVGAWGPHCPA